MLRWLRGLSVTLVLIASIVIGALMTVQNAAPVPLDLLFISLAPRPFGIWLIASFIVGAIVALGFSSWAIGRARVGRRLASLSNNKSAND
ncbi:MAG: LapA family protein [Luminiphilus sp.]|nr:LapA family protein [Luminiphilus sp.]